MPALLDEDDHVGEDEAVAPREAAPKRKAVSVSEDTVATNYPYSLAVTPNFTHSLSPLI